MLKIIQTTKALLTRFNTDHPGFKGLVINLLLAIVAKVLSLVLTPISIGYAVIRVVVFAPRGTKIALLSQYFLDMAIMIDMTGNSTCRYFFNDILIKPNGYQFGKDVETISSVLGKNYEANTLLFMGKGVSNTLDDIEKNHVIKSINDNPEQY